MRQTRLASIVLCFLLVVDIATHLILDVLALPQQQQQKHYQDIDTSKRNVTRVEARLRDKVELSCVIPEGQVFRGWRHRGRDAREVPGISSAREMHEGMLSEKLIINNFHLGLAGEYVCVRAKEATPDIENSGTIDLYLRRDGLESVDAATRPTVCFWRHTHGLLLVLIAGSATFFSTLLSHRSITVGLYTNNNGN